jgi:hypothetical protein
LYNLRYHIASLVAVFLALAIGLVLGGLVVRQGGFDQQQRALVTSLQSEFNKLKKNNSTLQSSLSFESAYAKQMTDAWTAGRLTGRTVAVFTSGSSKEGADEAAADIKAAGGTVALITLLKPDFGLKESQIASSVASVLGSASAAPTVTDVATGLVAEWNGTGSSHALTDALVSANALKVTGLSRSTVATLALDVATSDRNPDSAGLELASAYAAAGMYAVGAETLDSEAGVAAAASARQLSAFDTLGTNAGRFTLVALFTGGDQGYYSNTARGASMFPPVPKP